VLQVLLMLQQLKIARLMAISVALQMVGFVILARARSSDKHRQHNFSHSDNGSIGVPLRPSHYVAADHIRHRRRNTLCDHIHGS
jgi:hypothetical protein